MEEKSDERSLRSCNKQSHGSLMGQVNSKVWTNFFFCIFIAFACVFCKCRILSTREDLIKTWWMIENAWLVLTECSVSTRCCTTELRIDLIEPLSNQVAVYSFTLLDSFFRHTTSVTSFTGTVKSVNTHWSDRTREPILNLLELIKICLALKT